jgi:fructosamine-3-kinase
MAAKQLAELKNQIKKLLEKGYVHPSLLHGEPL